MVAMFTEVLFNQFLEFYGYVHFDIIPEWWIESYNVPRLVSPWLRLLMFVLLELDFLLISTVF